MTGKELLENKNTKYLFTQKGYDFYSLRHRFYKLNSFNADSKAIPVDIEEQNNLNEFYN